MVVDSKSEWWGFLILVNRCLLIDRLQVWCCGEMEIGMTDADLCLMVQCSGVDSIVLLQGCRVWISVWISCDVTVPVSIQPFECCEQWANVGMQPMLQGRTFFSSCHKRRCCCCTWMGFVVSTMGWKPIDSLSPRKIDAWEGCWNDRWFFSFRVVLCLGWS